MEQKKRQLEENVDSLNEELVKLSAQGTPQHQHVTATALLEASHPQRNKTASLERFQSHMPNMWDLTQTEELTVIIQHFQYGSEEVHSSAAIGLES